MPHDVFVSYSSKDKPVADAAVAALEARGLRCWIAPRDIVGGVDWSEAIIEAINGSRVMLLVFSSNANDSHQVKREVERAVAKGIPIIPLRIEAVPLAKSLEYFISMPHWIDALTPERRERLDYLAETVALLLERQAGRATPSRPPAPPPGDAQPDASRRKPLLAGLLVAALAVALAIALFRPKPVPPGPVPPAGESAPAPVDRRLVGDWSATVTTNGVTTLQRMSVRADGRVSWEISMDDAGTMAAAAGTIRQVTGSKAILQSTYSFRSDDAVTIAGPLGTTEWTRVRAGAGGSPGFDGRLAGTWQSTALDPEGRAWTSTLDMQPTGAYTFRAVFRDEGLLRENGGRFNAESTSVPGRNAAGAMSFDGAGSVITRDDRTGLTVRWTRVP